MDRRKFVKILKTNNYYFDRYSKGTHQIFKNDETKDTIVLAIKHKHLSIRLLKAILKHSTFCLKTIDKKIC